MMGRGFLLARRERLLDEMRTDLRWARIELYTFDATFMASFVACVLGHGWVGVLFLVAALIAHVRWRRSDTLFERRKAKVEIIHRLLDVRK
jgi:hypothetical protein